MKKLILAGLIFCGLSTSAMAANVTLGLSKTSQDFTLLGNTFTYDNTGLFVDWRSDTLFGTDKMATGVLWNAATQNGRVLEAYIMPKLKMSEKVSAFARIGYSLSGASGVSGGSFAWGLGGSYAITPNIAAELTYDRLYDNAPWTMSATSLGVNFKY